MNIFTSEVEYLRERVRELETRSLQLQALIQSLGYTVNVTKDGLKAVPIKEKK